MKEKDRSGRERQRSPSLLISCRRWANEGRIRYRFFSPLGVPFTPRVSFSLNPCFLPFRSVSPSTHVSAVIHRALVQTREKVKGNRESLPRGKKILIKGKKDMGDLIKLKYAAKLKLVKRERCKFFYELSYVVCINGETVDTYMHNYC